MIKMRRKTWKDMMPYELYVQDKYLSPIWHKLEEKRIEEFHNKARELHDFYIENEVSPAKFVKVSIDAAEKLMVEIEDYDDLYFIFVGLETINFKVDPEQVEDFKL